MASRRVSLPVRAPFSRLNYAACERLIAVSPAVARGLVDDGLSARHLLLVHDGVVDRPPEAGGREADLGVPPGVPVIGNVAALTEHEDHATLLAAMPRVLRAVPGARLVIVGEGWLRGPLEAEALQRGLGDRCVFTGFWSDVDRFMSAFSLLCLTSSTEGLGSSLLDAMCFGRAVVATETGGIPEAVVHGRTGLLVPVGDPSALAAALTRLLLSPGEREAMGRAGRRRFERSFTADRMIDGTLHSDDSLPGVVAAVGRSAFPVADVRPEAGYA